MDGQDGQDKDLPHNITPTRQIPHFFYPLPAFRHFAANLTLSPLRKVRFA